MWCRIPDLNPQGMTVNLDYVWKIKITHQPLISSRTRKSEVKNIPEDGDLTKSFRET